MLAFWEINQVFQYRAEAEGPCGQPGGGQAGREPQLSCATSEKTATCHNLSPKKATKPRGSTELQRSPVVQHLEPEKGTKEQRQEGERHNGLFLKRR